MEISTKYDPQQVEQKWYNYWLKHNFFASKPDNREPFTIVIPPPNVTGVLHMGHMLNNTIQDVLIRRARMQGKNACWVPGTDHASIATEAKVVAMLKEKGIEKKDLTREEFLKYAFKWKEKYGGIILEQLKKLGCSCDWSRTRFTMEEELSRAVIKSFVHLYRKGWIYRGVRMVNWDPVGKTALSDEEVIFKETQSKMVYVKYALKNTADEYITVATVRPETIPGDVAVCVNPNDERYKHLIGKTAIVPLVGREVPIIADEYVDMEFGTGTLKITPAHDIADYEIGLKHNLPAIDTIAEDGTMSEAVGIAKYVGKDRFWVRKEIIKDLQEAGLLVKIEDYKHQVGTSERTGAVIEPKLSMQWWLKMSEIAKPAYENVMNDTIRFFPEKFKNMYRSWMENPKDWCISRQLWWGQQIPAFYDNRGNVVVAETYEEALQEYQKLFPDAKEVVLHQDEDVLDTWFSSWLWPISVFDGFKDPQNEDIRYYYPTDVLVTGFDIIFFWVARMIMAGYEFRGEKPFKDVYFTGLIRDKLGRKMSKSLGNSPDALKLMELYSADGVRFGVLFSSAAGNDLLFDTPVPKSQKKEDIEAFLNSPDSHNSKLCEQGRNFANKIWNSYRLIKSWKVESSSDKKNSSNQVATFWFEARLNEALTEIEDHFTKYRISEALQTIYKLFWDDFCSWYLEIIKPEYGKPIETNTYEKTISFFDTLLRILHPFMPFITEEVWQNIQPRQEAESICVAPYPQSQNFDKNILKEADLAFETVTQIRNVRNAHQISPKEILEIAIKKSENENILQKWQRIIEKLATARISFVEEKPNQSVKFLVKTEEFFAQIAVEIDLEQVKKDLEYYRGFRESVLKKLSNEKFVANAKPEIVENERKKLADAEAKIKALEEVLG
ncbi:valine--tRNA ligase [Raineya orbicola]|uniref:Valine--tRNA ligase n=1 Tax=Raineya orbicola TaxID=2016530 RepID=A0A2N3IJH6_9BACT|nr:valine--tRNA ligase [Raineya orbicola]PKQ70408.1 valS: valine--tRNA ligase [Raineya orbicola]